MKFKLDGDQAENCIEQIILILDSNFGKREGSDGISHSFFCLLKVLEAILEILPKEVKIELAQEVKKCMTQIQEEGNDRGLD